MRQQILYKEKERGAGFLKIIFYWSIAALQCCLVPDVQQGKSAICIPKSPLFWISFPFRALNRVPCAVYSQFS